MATSKTTKTKTPEEVTEVGEKEPTTETTPAAEITPVEGRRDGNGALII